MSHFQDAIATSRVSSFGTIGAGLVQFHKAGRVAYKLALKILLWSIAGSVLGAYWMLRLDAYTLEQIVGGLMLFFS